MIILSQYKRQESEVKMEEEVKEQIKAMLLLLANTLQNNCVSMANDTDGNLYFFDTATFTNMFLRKYIKKLFTFFLIIVYLLHLLPKMK